MNKRAALVYSLVAWAIAMGSYMLVRYYGTAEVVDFARNQPSMMIVGWAIGSILLGLAYFGADVLGSKPSFRTRSYGFLMFLRGLLLVGAMIVIIFVARSLAVAQGTLGASDLIPAFWDRLTHKTTFAALVYLALVTAVITFIKQMIDRSGSRVIKNLITGKYHFPREEYRIFMFLDLRSSTTLAERLGHVRYSRLIQDCFRDLTDSAIRHEVEIYQYVGDEAVLTWEMETGLRNNNCIRIFFDFNQELQAREAYYQSAYGIVPEFKAGVNAGTVMVAEVGVIKREIAYHSDVLNTAARIQSKCNELGYDLLVSAQTKALLPTDPELNFTSVGHIALRGKDEKVEILGVGQDHATPSAAKRVVQNPLA